MSYVAVIVGISGTERFLARGKETIWPRQARKFRSDRAAEFAAADHIKAFPSVVQRSMSFRVEPLQ